MLRNFVHYSQQSTEENSLLIKLSQTEDINYESKY